MFQLHLKAPRNDMFHTLLLLFCYPLYVYKHVFIITNLISTSKVELIQPWKLIDVDS